MWVGVRTTCGDEEVIRLLPRRKITTVTIWSGRGVARTARRAMTRPQAACTINLRTFCKPDQCVSMLTVTSPCFSEPSCNQLNIDAVTRRVEDVSESPAVGVFKPWTVLQSDLIAY